MSKPHARKRRLGTLVPSTCGHDLNIERGTQGGVYITSATVPGLLVHGVTIEQAIAKVPQAIIALKIMSMGWICGECAGKLGGVWPKGHCATFSTAECSNCKEDKGCCCPSDYDWPGRNVSMAREI